MTKESGFVPIGVILRIFFVALSQILRCQRRVCEPPYCFLLCRRCWAAQTIRGRRPSLSTT